MDGNELWKRKQTITADNNLDLVLCSAVNLPVKYWRPNFFFIGMRDEETFRLTNGRFPAKLVPKKSHPVFALHSIADNTAFRVCPCSTKKPFYRGRHKFIKSGCKLKITNRVMDKTSYLVSKIKFPVGGENALRLGACQFSCTHEATDFV